MTDVRRRVAATAHLGALAAVDATVPRWPDAWIERAQRRRVRAIVQHAYASVPFYRAAIDAAGLHPGDFRSAADLARLPLIDADVVQRDREQFQSSAYGRNARKGFHTSGSTTGVRRLVFWDDGALLRLAAHRHRDRRVLASLAGESSVATLLRELAGERRGWWQRAIARAVGCADDHRRLSIVPLDYASVTHRALWSQSTLIPARASHYRLLSPSETFAAAAAELDRVRPRVVFSYGSYADEFLRYLDDTGLRVALPRLWVYMGDSVGARARELAGELGCRLYSAYASIEAGTIGFQCERGDGFHLNVDLCAVRIVDDAGRPLPDGETGDVVVSNLENRATVLLNYRQGDRGVVTARPCPCGRRLPLLERLEGRRSEVVETADGRRISALNLEGLFRAELRRTRQCQLHQRAPGVLTWRIVPADDVDRDLMRTSIVERGRTVLGEDTALEVEFTDCIAKTARGKLLRVTHA